MATRPPTSRIRTLGGEAPTNSVGLKTSVAGRVLFVGFATALHLAWLAQCPMAAAPHLVAMAAYAVGAAMFGTAGMFVKRPTRMLLETCVLLGVVNALIPPQSVAGTWAERFNYGATRGAAFAALSICTLLVTSITRPSDLARTAGSLTRNVYTLMLLAVPLATVDVVASSYNEMLTVASVRYATLRQPWRLHKQIVDVASGLLAAALSRVFYLTQVAYSLSAPQGASARWRAFARQPLFRLWDVLMLSLLLPSIILRLWI